MERVQGRLALAVAATAILLSLASLALQWRATRAPAVDVQPLLARLDAIDARLATQPAGYPAQDFGASAPVQMRMGMPAGAQAEPMQGGAAASAEAGMRQRRQEQQWLEAEFAAQPAAPRNDAMPQQVMGAFASDATLGALDVPRAPDVQCRADACRIEAHFAAGEDSADWTTRLMLELGTALPSYRTVNVPQPDGGYALRVYAARARPARG